MLNINITAIQSLIKYFASRQIEEVAREVGFTKRRDGKLSAKTFFKAFTIGLWYSHNANLAHTAQLCEDIQDGLSITKQALHKKLKTGAELLKRMFDFSMNYSIKYSPTISTSNILNQFNNIIICDSTYLSLPDKLKQFFKGVGGKGKSESAIKIQAEFNFKTKSFRNLEITEGSECDQSRLSSILESVEENDLILHDMGYFSLNFFKDIDSKNAYYLTRVPYKTTFFPDMKRAKDKPLPIEDVLDVNKDIIDTNIFIGTEKKTRIAARVVAMKLPPSITNERIRRANKKVTSRGVTLSKRQKWLLYWNIIITNAPSEKLCTELALELYKLRWQIEIIFKAWKSHMSLENVAQGGKAQVECLLYGRLIVITMMTAIYSQFYLLLLVRKYKELSILRFFSLLAMKSRDIVVCVCSGINQAYKLLAIMTKIAEKSIYEKRKRQSTLELILSYEKPILENCGLG